MPCWNGCSHKTPIAETPGSAAPLAPGTDQEHLTPPQDTTQPAPHAERRTSGAMVPLLRLDYLLTAFQTHHTTSATSTHGTSARKTISTSSTSSTTKAETAVRLVSAFASSVIKRQRGSSDIGSRRGTHPNGMDPCITGKNRSQRQKLEEATSPGDRLTDHHHL